MTLCVNRFAEFTLSEVEGLAMTDFNLLLAYLRDGGTIRAAG
jgi:hypothetical protein